MRTFTQFMHHFSALFPVNVAPAGRFSLCSTVKRLSCPQPVVRPRFFSRAEWWYHIAMMPVLFPLGNYFFIGPRYFQHAATFWVGTGVVFCLYWLSIVTLTLAVRRVIARFPAMHQTWPRLATMLLVVGLLTAGLAIFDVWVYSVVPATGVPFRWATVRQIWLLGGVFDLLLCTALGLFYMAEQWKQNQTEAEHLKQQQLYQQIDALKNQVNPHFLFNALNAISALIGEDRPAAEQFVDQLAKVYRYMLQANSRAVVPLHEELAFVSTYADLLRIRYGDRLVIQLPTSFSDASASLPPLSLQALIDNALKHNCMSVQRPLTIRVELYGSAKVRVSNTLHRRPRVVNTAPGGLQQLRNRYVALTQQPMRVEDNGQMFSVTLPLF